MNIFLSAPYSIDPDECVRTMLDIRDKLQKRHPSYNFFVPHCAFDPDRDYMDIMVECMHILAQHDQLWVCGPRELSKGSQAEIAFANACKIPIKDVSHLWYLFDGPV